MKKLLFLFILMLLPIVASAATVEINGIYYYLDAGKASVTSNPNKYSGNVVIPKQITYQGKNYPVTIISISAFSGCTGLTSITIPNSVTSIISSAFSGCSGLTSINIPSSVTSIGDFAFENCSGLTSVTIPNSVTSIKYKTFSNCSGLTSINIPSSVTSIGESAFDGCSSLTSINIPSGVTSIGNYAFKDCTGLTSVNISDIAAWCKVKFNYLSNPLYYAQHLYLNGNEVKDLVIPNSVESIGNSAFSGCTGLTSVTIPNSVTSIGYSAFSGCTGLTSVTIPNTVTSIGGSVFDGCSSLTSINIPSGVTSIGDRTFYGCTGLTSINIPSGVTSIGNYAFYGCSGLTSINIPSGVTSIGQYAYYGCCGLTTVTIPSNSNLTSIGNYSFYGCSGLTSINIPSGVTSIGYYAFKGCSGLTSITIPNSVTSIDVGTFYNCSNLESIDISNGVTSIDNQAFFGCSSLKTITIPQSMASISSEAFGYCYNLTDVYSMAESLRTDNSSGEGLYTAVDAFRDSNPQNITLHVPAVSLASYQSINPWKSFKSIEPLSNPNDPKCETPEINYVNGMLSFSCATDGVEFVSEVTSSDIKKRYDAEFMLSHIYLVSVYATKSGYQPSDVATMEIDVSGNEQPALKGDLNDDGVVDVADHVELTKIIMTSVTDPDNPSDDNIDTDKVTAHFTGGAYMKVNDCIQSGSKLNVQLSNRSEKTITLTGIYLIDGQTKVESDNLFTDSMEIPSGADFGYTITVGANGITIPIVRFTYSYNNKNYTAEDQWKETNTP